MLGLFVFCNLIAFSSADAKPPPCSGSSWAGLVGCHKNVSPHSDYQGTELQWEFGTKKVVK